VFPQGTFPELAIFSKNLVPACICNTLRQDSYVGPQPGERVLHPYFDSRLSQRLVRATLTPTNGNYHEPSITIEPCIPNNDPLLPALSYHLENVVLCTHVLAYLDVSWLKLLRLPQSFSILIPNGAFTMTDLDQAINEALQIIDSRRSTPNNWES